MARITESQLRVIVKQELKKVLFENVQNVDDVNVKALTLIDSFDELKYADDEYGENIYKFKNGQEIGELTQEQIDIIDKHMDKITDTFRVSLNNFDATVQAEIIGDKFGKTVSKYIRTKEELLALQASREAAAKKQQERYAELRRKNDEYFKKNPI